MTVTLDDLRAQFEDAVAKHSEQFYAISFGTQEELESRTAEQIPFPMLTVDDFNCPETTMCSLFGSYPMESPLNELWRKAKIYLIARDDGFKAAMLWKLQNGGAL